MSRVIESRNGAEVYASDTGWVCIKQDTGVEPPVTVTIHPDDIDELIEGLKEVQQEALHIRHSWSRLRGR